MTKLLQKSKTLTRNDSCKRTMLNHKLSRSSEGQGHNDACLSKGPDLSNNVCEYEVNRLTTEN